jgi:hypothetical protein
MTRRLLGFCVAAGLLCGMARASDWVREVVDQSGEGLTSSLKIDSEGNVHLVYTIDDGNQYPLKYAFWDHAVRRWFRMDVAKGASFCSLALDSKQRPHISFADFGTLNGARLRYAYWDGAVWKVQAIPLNSEIIGYFTSIILDSQDRPIISFYEYRGPRDSGISIRLRVVRWTGEEWEVQTVDGTPGSGKFNALAIDPRGALHLAYANVASGTYGMRYAFWNGKWAKEIVDGPEQNDGDGVGYSTAIALDAEGNPHITYLNEVKGIVKYAHKRNGHWDVQTVDRLVRPGYPDRNSIVFDADGRPYLGYYDAGQGVLKVAHQESGRWVPEVVDSNFSGFNSSLQTSGKTLWISYADMANHGVRVAHKELENDSAPVPAAHGKSQAK